MKYMKIIGLLAILAVLVTLSGCDAILEAFYPELTDKFGSDGGNNAIGVYVEVTVPGTDVQNPQLAAKVEDAWSREFITDAFFWPNWNWDDQGNVILSGYLELYNIPSGTSVDDPREFRVIVWLERTTGDNANNGFPDFDEPSQEAEYMNTDGVTDNIFRFPSNMGTWVEASAYLNYFGGAQINRDFNVLGTRVFNLNNLYFETYDVVVLDPDAPPVQSLYYSLGGPWGEMDSGVENFTGGAPSFNLDFTGYPEGYYWLYVEVGFELGTANEWWEPKGFPMRVVTNEYGASQYDADVLVYNTTMPPFNLSSGTPVFVQYRIIHPDGSDFVSALNVAPAADGGLNFVIPSITYNPTAYYDFDGVDMLQVNIDINGNGYTDPGDFYAQYPLGVSANDILGGTYPLYVDMWPDDFRPILP